MKNLWDDVGGHCGSEIHYSGLYNLTKMYLQDKKDEPQFVIMTILRTVDRVKKRI
jgi:hypothetical protein